MTTLDVIGVKPKVLEILEVNPALSYSLIADEVGVTRERVRQIAQQNGYPSRRGILKPKICSFCKGTYYAKNLLYCSTACKNKARRRKVVVNCHWCGKPIERTPGTMRSRSGRYYCNRACYESKARKNHFLENLHTTVL